MGKRRLEYRSILRSRVARLALSMTLVVFGVIPGLAWSALAQESPWFEASLSGPWVHGCGFAMNSSVDVVINDTDGTTELLNESEPTDGDGCFNVYPSFFLFPDMFVSVSDTANTKELTLVPLSIDVVDTANDTASGTAPPDTTFNVDTDICPGGCGDYVSAYPVDSDANGDWTADFGALGVDFVPGNNLGANITDDDGDNTIFDVSVPFPPVFEVTLTSEPSASADEIFACCESGWTPNSSVTVQILKKPGGTSLFGPASVPTDVEGSFTIRPQTHGVDFVAGMHVVVTENSSSIAKDLTLAALTFDVLDPDTDTASGTAPPGAEVWVEAGVPQSESVFNVTCCVVADSSGNWFADFGAEGFDVTASMGGTAIVDDDDGDSTRAGTMPQCPAPCEVGWGAVSSGHNITVSKKTDLFLNPGWGWASDQSLTDPSNYEEEFVSGGYTFTMLVDGEALAYETVIAESPNTCGPRGDTGEEQCADATYVRWQYFSKPLTRGVHTVSFELTILKDFPDDGWGFAAHPGDVFEASNTIWVVRG